LKKPTQSKLIFAFFLLLTFFVALSSPLAAQNNIILFIGDGMGFEHVRAAGMYSTGLPGSLCFEAFPGKSAMTTFSADNAITDSAASGTAIATGRKVNNGTLGLAIPGDGKPLPTVLEILKKQGKSVGLVTTTYITHATPAAFAAHQPSRANAAEIAADYLDDTLPNVLFGGGGMGMTPKLARQHGYRVIQDANEFSQLDTDTVSMVSGQFGQGHMPYEFDGLGNLPHLSQMTETALKVLDNNPKGFFLMVEGGRIDHAGHANDLARDIFEAIEFAHAVQTALDWASNHPDTLIIVTADHETGGLQITKNNGKGQLPDAAWQTDYHTSAKVPVYVWGSNAEQIASAIQDNTDIFTQILTAAASTTKQK